MKSINKLLLIIIASLFISGCENYLDRPPLSEITPDKYLWNESQLASYAVGLYDMFPTHSSGGQFTFGTFEIDKHTDDMAAMGYSNIYVPGQWRVDQAGGEWDFDNIYQCNYFLNTVLPRKAEGTLTGSQVLNDHYIGEVYFMRAWEYFDKLKALGDFPIVKNTLADNMKVLTEASKRDPRTEVARFILSDLDSAIMLMQDESPDGAKNRLSKPVAQLFKSRVALFEATWLKYFKDTAFVPNGPGWPGAGKAYNQNYQFKSGSIEAEIDWLLDQAMDAARAVAEQIPLEVNNDILQQSPDQDTNPYFNMFSRVDMAGFDEVLFWRRYDNGLFITHNVPVYAQRGNHGVGVTRGLVNSFLMKNGLPIYAPGSGYQGDDHISDVRANRDGRLWLFLKEPGQVNVLYPSPQGTHATYIEPIPDITSSTVELAYSTGYAIRKGLNYDAAQSANGEGYTGSIVFRAVEAYLNYLEASYEKNGVLDDMAIKYWKMIRERGGVDTDFNKTIAATEMQQEALYDWGAYSGGQLIDPTLYNIRRERRNELMAEGLRGMDLKRWRAMDQLIANPYQIEGFKLWGPMQDWYKDEEGDLTITYGSEDATVSDPESSIYLRPYQVTGRELVYDGYQWAMAHYLHPIAIQHFLITSEGNDVSTSPIYQNPGWPTSANMPPDGF